MRQVGKLNAQATERGTYKHGTLIESHGSLVLPAFQNALGFGGLTEHKVMAETDSANDVESKLGGPFLYVDDSGSSWQGKEVIFKGSDVLEIEATELVFLCEDAESDLDVRVRCTLGL